MYVLQYFFSSQNQAFLSFGSDLSYDQSAHLCGPQECIFTDVKVVNFHESSLLLGWYYSCVVHVAYSRSLLYGFLLLVYKLIKCLGLNINQEAEVVEKEDGIFSFI